MINTHIHQIHLLISEALEIEDYQWKSTHELNEQIGVENSSIHEKLNSYVENLLNWFEVCEKIEKEGKTPKLHEQLLNFINNRDDSRQTLINSVRSIK